MGRIWELDFYSRPVLDENQKKRWELLICESQLGLQEQPSPGFQYSQFCSGTEVNSVWLRDAIATALENVDYQPDKIRFFRQPMMNMILKACSELGLTAQMSRRTFTLQQWLTERLATVYPQDPGYQAGTTLGVSLPAPNPQPLPDALRGQKWAFANLGLAELEELAGVAVDFGEVFPPRLVGLTDERQIPGLVIFSERALALAAWMSGLDLAYVKLDLQPTPALGKRTPHRLVLETGGDDRWILATFGDAKLLAEGQAFETAKTQSCQVHFLAVQSSAPTPEVAGFWLLQDIALG